MRTYLIAYDLAKPNRNKHALATAIMSLGQSWARPLEHTWYLKADISEVEVETRLMGLLDEDDGLIVQAVHEPAVLANTALRWFCQRRPGFDVAAAANVIAFPTPPAEPAREPELPFANAG